MPQIIPVAIFDCVVFGATGDLTLRKLLPALYYRFRDGQMPAESRIIGAARSDLSDKEFRARANKALQKHVASDDQDAETMQRFVAQLHYVSIDATAANADWSRFNDVLDPARVRVFYLGNVARPVRPGLQGAGCQRSGNRGFARGAGKADRA